MRAESFEAAAPLRHNITADRSIIIKRSQYEHDNTLTMHGRGVFQTILFIILLHYYIIMVYRIVIYLYSRVLVDFFYYFFFHVRDYFCVRFCLLPLSSFVVPFVRVTLSHLSSGGSNKSRLQRSPYGLVHTSPVQTEPDRSPTWLGFVIQTRRLRHGQVQFYSNFKRNQLSLVHGKQNFRFSPVWISLNEITIFRNPISDAKWIWRRFILVYWT